LRIDRPPRLFVIPDGERRSISLERWPGRGPDAHSHFPADERQSEDKK